MSNYILAYHGGSKPANPEEGVENMAKWQAWADNLGDALTVPGAPLGMSKTISADGVSDGGGENPLVGYSILKADDMDSAIEMVKACPHTIYGTMEVAEIMEMQ
jgi:hypothetical protein